MGNLLLLQLIICRVLACVGAGSLLLPGPTAAQAPTAHQTHDLLAAFIAAHASRQLASGDTLVSWYDGRPILLHLVQRSQNQVSAAMVRGEAYLGTSAVRLDGGRPTQAQALWTSGDSVETQVVITASADSIRITGTTRAAYPIPKEPWGVADYGMEDLLVPVLASLNGAPQPWRVLIYRPFAAKWDLVTVTASARGKGKLYELTDPDGSKDWWLVAPTGALVDMRRGGQNFERRPLEETPLWAQYESLGALPLP